MAEKHNPRKKQFLLNILLSMKRKKKELDAHIYNHEADNKRTASKIIVNILIPDRRKPPKKQKHTLHLTIELSIEHWFNSV